tara:strand:- start:1408 stop:1575 length:168 start_codon:yes stop_codon:yes gene_type:complete
MIDCAAVPSQNGIFISGSRDNAIGRRQKRPAIKIDYPKEIEIGTEPTVQVNLHET